MLADIYNDRRLAHFALQDTQAAMLDFNLAIRLNATDYRDQRLKIQLPLHDRLWVNGSEVRSYYQ